jgi:hypothetical protein
MSFKKFIILAILSLGIFCQTDDIAKTVPCFKNFSEGECGSLDPPATACVWKPHDSNGWCARRVGNTYVNDFNA